MNLKNISQGISLIEVLVATAILAMFLVAIVAVVTKSISNTNESQNRVVAYKYLDDSIELVRNDRDRMPWDYFKATHTGIIYPDLFINYYYEEIIYQEIDPNKVQITITVGWDKFNDSATIWKDKFEHTISSTIFLTKWK